MSAEMDVMDCRPNSPPIVLRRLVAVVMAVAMIAASLATLAREPSFSAARGEGALVASAKADLLKIAFSKNEKGIAKPCQKAVLPGGVNSCSAGFVLAGMPASEPADVIPQMTVQKLHWRLADVRFAAQCGGPSLDRPPCPVAV